MNTESQTHEFKVGSLAALQVRNIRGDVEIVPGADGLIAIEVVTYPDDGHAADTRIELTQDDDGLVRAEVTVPDKWLGFSSHKPLRVDFRITAPARTDIKARLVSGSVRARGFEGTLKLQTVSGSVVAEDLRGDLDLDSVSGKLTGRGLSGTAHLSVVSGRVSLQESDLRQLSVSTVSGRAEIETGLGEGPYKFSTVSGSVALVVPEGSGCRVDASAVSGRFYTDLPVSHSSRSGKRWQVVVGEGGPSVKMKSVSGKLRLVTSLEARGSEPGEVHLSREKRKDILDQLSQGEISVEDAMKALAP
jgi:DUF4097 and DUF4098 domain-containing protein YvlB